MDILKEFDEFLPKWCHEHHVPVPKEQFSDNWKLAWNDYVKQILEPNIEEIRQDYYNLPTTIERNRVYSKSTSTTVNKSDQPEKKVEPVKAQPKNDWDIVQELMKKQKY